MRRVGLGMLLALVVAAGSRAEEGKGPLAPGKDLPGPFHPYNINGERRGFYHCPVSRVGFDPAVMVVIRGLRTEAPFRTLLTGLDGLVKNNPRSRLHAFVVFLSDEVPRPISDEDKRRPVVAKLEDLVKDFNLQHVT